MAEWNDDRGFGFITPDSGGPRVFVHVSAFPRGQRPTASEVVTYDVRKDERNRLTAADVRRTASARAPRAGTHGLPETLIVAALFFALLVVIVFVERAPVALLIPYTAFSLIALVMYRADKAAAVRGSWRTPESNLHLVALLGGWPGALVAQRAFRHKTKKQPFVTIFWGTVLVNCVALAWVVYEMPLA